MRLLPLLPVRTDSRGLLITVEGPSRIGKSTLLTRLEEHFVALGREIVRVGWNSDPIIQPATTALKAVRGLSPWTFSLIHLADYRRSYDSTVLPALSRNAIVLSDRYVYTAWVRDTLRGVPSGLLGEILKTFVRPDLALIPAGDLPTIMSRFREQEKTYGYYGTAADIYDGISSEESFFRYQSAQLDLYLSLVEAGILRQIDASMPLGMIIDSART